MNAAGDLALLKLDVAISLVIGASGRIEAGPLNHPGPRQDSIAASRSAGPRLYFAGCATGNIVRLRHDVDEQSAARVLALAAAAPSWSNPDAPPDNLAEIVERLSQDTPVEVDGPEIVFRLPNGLEYAHGATIVRSDTTEGDELLARLARQGMPQSLLDAGFLSLGDFWWPWCVALEGGEIAAMAFAARLGEAGAEIGVYTFTAFRGRGFAAAATAAWSSLDSLKGRDLIYSTRLTNHSSRQVAARLGLRGVGARVRINDR